MRLLTYNDLINRYIFNNKICKYNNYKPQKNKFHMLSSIDDVKKFIQYYHFDNNDFGDLSIADEIIINDGTYNTTWVIVGFNTHLDTDVNNGSYSKNHICLFPKSFLSTVVMCNGNTNGGFANTEMFKKTLVDVNNNLSNVLDNYLLPHEVMLSTDGKNASSYQCKSMIPNIPQCIGISGEWTVAIKNGHVVKPIRYVKYSRDRNGAYADGNDNVIFPLLKMEPEIRSINHSWWLRDSYFQDYYTAFDCDGILTYAGQGYHSTLRPYILLGKY